MRNKSRFVLAIMTFGFAFDAVVAAAQGWPARPITMVVPLAAGGAGDALARIACIDAKCRRGLRHQLSQAERAGARARRRIPARLDRDDGDEQSRVEILAVGLRDRLLREVHCGLAIEGRVEALQRTSIELVERRRRRALCAREKKQQRNSRTRRSKFHGGASARFGFGSAAKTNGLEVEVAAELGYALLHGVAHLGVKLFFLLVGKSPVDHVACGRK